MTDLNRGFRITPERYAAAGTLDAYIDSAARNQDFWRGVHRTARIPEELVQRAFAIPGTWHLLALSEDWCTDAVNTLPVLARLVEATSRIDLRLLPRDLNPDLMNAHLTRGTRSIPVVMVFDAEFAERGWWGPRPTVLQQWYEESGRGLDPLIRSRQKREWYARDRGVSAMTEVLALIEGAAVPAPGAGDSSGAGPRR